MPRPAPSPRAETSRLLLAAVALVAVILVAAVVGFVSPELGARLEHGKFVVLAKGAVRGGARVTLAWGTYDARRKTTTPPSARNKDAYPQEKLLAIFLLPDGRRITRTLAARTPNDGSQVVAIPRDIPEGSRVTFVVQAVNRANKVVSSVKAQSPLPVTAGEPVAVVATAPESGGEGGGGGESGGGGGGGAGGGGGSGGGGSPATLSVSDVSVRLDRQCDNCRLSETIYTLFFSFRTSTPTTQGQAQLQALALDSPSCDSSPPHPWHSDITRQGTYGSEGERIPAEYAAPHQDHSVAIIHGALNCPGNNFRPEGRVQVSITNRGGGTLFGPTTFTLPSDSSEPTFSLPIVPTSGQSQAVTLQRVCVEPAEYVGDPPRIRVEWVGQSVRPRFRPTGQESWHYIPAGPTSPPAGFEDRNIAWLFDGGEDQSPPYRLEWNQDFEFTLVDLSRVYRFNVGTAPEGSYSTESCEFRRLFPS